MEQEEVLEGITVTDSHLDQAAALQQHQFIQAQQLQQQHMQVLQQFWHDQLQEVDHLIDTKAKNGLPLARIKKIMKFDEDVKTKMISAEAPALFAKACEVFITELTMRAFFHTEENKRRTLQRNDIAMAISRSDTFDFLIDIVPREDIKGKRPNGEEMRSAVGPEYFYLTQQPMDPQLYQQQLRYYQQQQLYQLQLQQDQGNDQTNAGGEEGIDNQLENHHQMALEGMAMVNSSDADHQRHLQDVGHSEEEDRSIGLDQLSGHLADQHMPHV